MQIYALDSAGSSIDAHHARRGHPYLCPECQGSVRLRGGKLRKLHFYHTDRSPCQLHGKSLTHLHIQYSLQQMLAPEEIWLEHRFPQIGRIADVAWPAQKLIFEVQVSPISAEEVNQRNRDYGRIGYSVIWILHDRQFNRSHLTEAELALRFQPHYFTNINALGKGIFYDQYAYNRFKRRIKKTRRLLVCFKRILPIQLKQLPRHFPPERKKWHLSFEGDLFSYTAPFLVPRPHTLPILRRVANFYKIFLHLLLEKTTY